MAEGRIKKIYNEGVGERARVLDVARTCALYTKPAACLPEGFTRDSELPSTYQSLGSVGITNLEGRHQITMFPPGLMWLMLLPSASIRFDPAEDPQQIQQASQMLTLYGAFIQALIETQPPNERSNRRASSFRSSKRQAIRQYLITGDVLEHMDDDFRHRVFARENYITKRDHWGNVMYHVTHEKITKDAIEPEVREHINEQELDKDLDGKQYANLYTMVEWDYTKQVWVIEQEIAGYNFNRSEEVVSPYFSTTFDLALGENYGRGFVEMNLPDFKALDALSKDMLSMSAISAKLLALIDHGSPTHEDIFTLESGSVARSKVRDGKPADLAFMHVDKMGDFAVVMEAVKEIYQRLSSAMLLTSPSIRDSERTTAYEVNQMTAEVESAHSGLFASVSDQQQIPLLRRAIHVAKKKKLIPAFREEDIDIELLTGVSAITKQLEAPKLLSFVSMAQQLGPEAFGHINMSVFLEVMARYSNIHERGMIRTADEMAALQRQQQQQAIEGLAAEKAIDTAGNTIESQLTEST